MPKTAVKSGACLILISALAACGGQSSPFMAPLSETTTDVYQRQAVLPAPIKHVIIIFQENRSPDYLFQDVPGADIAKTGIDSHGDTVPLHPVSLAAGYDLSHGHDAFVRDYADGKMDGFDQGLPQQLHLRPFGYAPAQRLVLRPCGWV